MTFTTLAWISIAIAILSALIIATDELRRPQKMAIMNIVWPVTALYFSVLGLWAYFAWGTKKSKAAMNAQHHQHAAHNGDDDHNTPPTLQQTAIGTSHCGAGCMIADVATDFAIASTGLVLFGSELWTRYALDLAAAWALGIVFQYFAIKPMRPNLTRGAAILAAIKADTLSILAFQIGMYLFMALTYFVLFPAPHLTAFDPRYWALMQLAMICGFVTSLPMNHLLIRRGWKEKM